MQVVLEGHADATVHLHAVLHQLAAVVADEGLGHAEQLRRVGGAGSEGGGGGVAHGVTRLEPGLHVGEPVLELLVGGQGTTERVAVERPLDGHVEGRLHGPDRLRRTRWRRRDPAAARPARRPSPTSPTTRSSGTRTSSNVTTENRRVRSTECMGDIDTPAVPAGTSTWVSPDPVRPVTSRWSARAADSTGRLTPLSTTSSPSTRMSSETGRARRSAAARPGTRWPPTRPRAIP